MKNTAATTEYFEIKAKDAFGDLWSTGKRFDTLADAKAFLNGPIEPRREARRNAEAHAGVKFTPQNPISWQVDRVTIG